MTLKSLLSMPADTICGREVLKAKEAREKKQGSGWGTYDVGRLVGLVIGLEVNIIYYARYKFKFCFFGVRQPVSAERAATHNWVRFVGIPESLSVVSVCVCVRVRVLPFFFCWKRTDKRCDTLLVSG